MTSSLRLRPILNSVPAYLSGKPAPTPEGVIPYKGSSNENPYPPLPSVQAVIAKAAGNVNRYPDMAVTELTERIADHFGVRPAQVATGTGGVGVLKQILEATSTYGNEVVFPWRSFEAYPILTTLTGATPVKVPLTADFRHDLDAMAAAVNEKTRAVMICSPNNPTGGSVRHDDLEDFLEKIPSDVAVVLDEAYVDFVTSPDAVDSQRILRDHRNVILLRTLSKSYGLASLRIGFSLAHEELSTAIRKTCLPFAVSGIAQTAAIASFDADAELQTRIHELVRERTRVIAGLREQGWRIPETDANFVWFDLGKENTSRFEAYCESNALSVRAYAGDGVRVTVAEPGANDRLLELAQRWLLDNPLPISERDAAASTSR